MPAWPTAAPDVHRCLTSSRPDPSDAALRLAIERATDLRDHLLAAHVTYEVPETFGAALLVEAILHALHAWAGRADAGAPEPATAYLLRHPERWTVVLRAAAGHLAIGDGEPERAPPRRHGPG